jgi:PleD family two-component response regulator
VAGGGSRCSRLSDERSGRVSTATGSPCGLGGKGTRELSPTTTAGSGGYISKPKQQRKRMKAASNNPVRRGGRKRVLIVNGVSLWREALKSNINRSPDLEICGEAFDERSAFEQVSRLQPDLVLSEILRPQDLGFIHELHRLHPRLPILAFSFRDEEGYAARALEDGARGFLMKGVRGNVLVAGIRKVLKGELALSSRMAVRLRCKRVRVCKDHTTRARMLGGPEGLAHRMSA